MSPAEHLDHEAAHAALDASREAAGPLRESIVDVLGSLVPGTTFLLATIPSLVVPMASVVLTLFPAWKPLVTLPEHGIEASIGTIVFVLVPGLLVFGVVAYVSGHLFFRQDPKVADEASFAMTRRFEGGDGMVRPDPREAGGRAAVPEPSPDGQAAAGGATGPDPDGDGEPLLDGIVWPEARSPAAPRAARPGFARRWRTFLGRRLRAAFALKPAPLPFPVEFPYRDLREYLAHRGLHYLARYVPWDRRTERTGKMRTKHRMNALKIRIQLECQPFTQLLARTEGHVRMSSSMWYVTRALIQMSTVSLVAYFGLVLYEWRILGVPGPLLTPVFVLPLSTFAAAHLVRHTIERTLHYQREREVLFILETAHWLYHTDRVPKLFDGLLEERRPS